MTQRRARIAAVVASVCLLAACAPVDGSGHEGGDGSPAPTTAIGAGGPIGTGRDVLVHLFEWNWGSVAKECPRLAAIGYGGVQVSPPQEHLTAPPFQWWQDYQPVSYQLESRRGTREQFSAMVDACHRAGVRIYADAVVNHMAGADSGTGTAGSTFTHYDYPGLWTDASFHHCGLAPNDDIADYGNAQQVQTCELVNLADLATDTEPVRARLTAYLDDLISLGVDGFRVDAAKHMAAADVGAIVSRLRKPVDVYQEVIDMGTEPIKATDYVGSGKVLIFTYGAALGREVQWGKLSNLKTLGGSVDSSKAMVFVDNHDNQRHGGSEIATSAKDPRAYTIANVYMLAWPYGSPVVMSSYAFTDPDAGPPAISDGTTKDTECGKDGWVCEHRWDAIAGMVGFHNAVAGTPMDKWWDDGGNAVAFARGDKGYVVINNATAPLTGRSFHTGLPAGTYCDVTEGRAAAGATSCPDRSVTVNADGWFTADLRGRDALAIDVADRPG